MTRVIRSEADLSRLLARPGYRLASQIGGEVVNTDQRAGRMPSNGDTPPAHVSGYRSQPSPPSTSGGVEGHARAQESLVGTLDQPARGTAEQTHARPAMTQAGINSGPLTLPWPPTGNSAVRHAQGVHYLRPEVVTYRDSVAALCAKRAPVRGRYRLHVHMSPPDARARDIDNALKSLLDALVKAGYMQSDSMTYMRELLVTVDDDRLGHVRLRAIPYDLEAA